MSRNSTDNHWICELGADVKVSVFHDRSDLLHLAGLAFQRSINTLAQHHRLGPWRFAPPDSITEGE